MNRTLTLITLFAVCFFSCRKKTIVDEPPVIVTPQDPPVAATVGFFLNDWAEKTFTTPAFTDTVPASVTPMTTVTVDRTSIITKIPNTVYGNNANPYMTQMVSEPVLIKQIRDLNPGIIRFPGGNLSSIYFWDSDGGMPADVPDTLLNADGGKVAGGYWYGKNNAAWTISLDNYYNMLQQTGSEGMITVNYGYARYGTSANPVAAAAHLAADWVRYDNGRTKYWEIGNESNGTWQAGYRIDRLANKDGQPEIITGDLYAQHAKVFADSMRKAAQQIGRTIYIGVQALEQPAAPWQTSTDKGWNTAVFTKTADVADYYIIHSYYTPFNTNSSAAEILHSASTVTADMISYVRNTSNGLGGTIKPIALTEWNIFATGSRQMVSNIAGLHAALVLGELIKNKYGQASRWDLANGWDNGNDHGMFSNGDEPGVPKWNPRPAFYHMYYFQKMTGDRMVPLEVKGNTNVVAYASTFSSGETGIVLINKGGTAERVGIEVKNFIMGTRCYWYLLTGGTDGVFSGKVFVNGRGPSAANGGPSNYTDIKPYSSETAGGLKFNLPAYGAMYMVVDNK
jgi:hypothetical protein